MPEEGRELTCPKCLCCFFTKPGGDGISISTKSSLTEKKSRISADKVVIVIILLIFTVLIWAIANDKKTKPSKLDTAKSDSSQSKATDYEHDLTERCKDWIYNRNRAYKLGREGDQQGSEQARIVMLAFMRDLEKYFTEKQISDEIARLEASGYKAGF